MFRKPRDPRPSVDIEVPLRPSTGRPPTPPPNTRKAGQLTAPTVTTYSTQSPVPLPLAGKSDMSSKRTPTTTPGKVKARSGGNGNIMNFFKRADSGSIIDVASKVDDDSLFFEEAPVKIKREALIQTPTPPREENLSDEIDILEDESPTSRFNEDPLPCKRRKTSELDVATSKPSARYVSDSQMKGPFADDSDSDEGASVSLKPPPPVSRRSSTKQDEEARMTTPPSDSRPKNDNTQNPPIPRLKQETTSVGETNNFGNVDDFIDDEFAEEGEEYIERRWMEMQAEMEMGLEDEELATPGELVKHQAEFQEPAITACANVESGSCPICGGSTNGLAEQVSGFV